MSPSQPTFPTQRAFVVQVHAEAKVELGQVWGRAEHIVSGQGTRFQSVEELRQFMVQVLTSAAEESTPPAESTEA